MYPNSKEKGPPKCQALDLVQTAPAETGFVDIFYKNVREHGRCTVWNKAPGAHVSA